MRRHARSAIDWDGDLVNPFSSDLAEDLRKTSMNLSFIGIQHISDGDFDVENSRIS